MLRLAPIKAINNNSINVVLLQIDSDPIFEPQFERINTLNPPSPCSLKAPVVWNGDIYALGRDISDAGRLYKYSLSKNEWSDFSIDSSIYASASILTTYHSKLLLVSGENMTVWEFSSDNFAFKPSNIKQVPSDFPRLNHTHVLTTSEDEELIIVSWDSSPFLNFVQLLYDGRDWTFKTYEVSRHPSMKRGVSFDYLTDGREIFRIATNNSCSMMIKVMKAPINSFDEDRGSQDWKELDIISCPEFEELIRVHGRMYRMILYNRQFYFTDVEGKIFTSFIQPLMVPVIWSKSGVKFQDAPYLVGLPNGTMLMMGMIQKHEPQQMLYEEQNIKLDVIIASQKGNDTSLTVIIIIIRYASKVQPFLSFMIAHVTSAVEATPMRFICFSSLHCMKNFRECWRLAGACGCYHYSLPFGAYYLLQLKYIHCFTNYTSPTKYMCVEL